MNDTAEYTPHPAKAFFGVLLAGSFLIHLSNVGRGEMNSEYARIFSATNTGGVFLSAIIAASTTRWKLPIFIKVILFHVGAASLLGYLSSGQRGLGYALGSSLAVGLMSATLAWIMLSSNWLFGRVVFWGLIGVYCISLLMFFLR